VYLTDITTVSDNIKIVQFGNNIYTPPTAFEIYKDMLNNFHYKRHSRNGNIVLAKDLQYFDTSLEVTDASALSTPIRDRNIPGVVIINNERIEYFVKTGNVLSQLRRGGLGTAIAETHIAGSLVVDIGITETLPYAETQQKLDFTSDGSSLLIGPLDFTPTKSTRSNWNRITIPEDFGPCDELEVFVSGTRLNKNSTTEYLEANGVASPSADVIVEAEFSVDGAAAYIRLTEAVPAGTRITVVRRLGRIWYERGETTASKGTSLLSNNTPIASFIAAKTTELPE
jgi:hypothetical protein